MPFARRGRLRRPNNYYYIAVGVVLIALLILYYVERAYISFQWRAIKDDNTLAGAVGINVIGYKTVNFVLAAFMAGISGALFASYQHNLSRRRHVPLRRHHVDLPPGVHGSGGQGLLHRPARGYDGSHPAGREHSFHAGVSADDHRRHRHPRHDLHADGARGTSCPNPEVEAGTPRPTTPVRGPRRALAALEPDEAVALARDEGGER